MASDSFSLQIALAEQIGTLMRINKTVFAIRTAIY